MSKHIFTVAIDAETRADAERLLTNLLSVAQWVCDCTHGGKIAPWDDCSVCKGSGKKAHPMAPRIESNPIPRRAEARE